jgi:predicted nuclease of predicted toxin-antitoxin system
VIRLLVDQNFNAHIVDGLTRRDSSLDLIHIRDVGLATALDPAVLEWAALQGRVLLTHDRRTIPGFAYARVASGPTDAGSLSGQ